MSVKQKSVTTALWERVFRSKAKSNDPGQDSNLLPKHDKTQPERDSEYQADEPELSYEMMNDSTTAASLICEQPPSRQRTDSGAINTPDSFSDSDNADLYEETEDLQDPCNENEYLAMSEAEEIYDEPPPELHISKRPLPIPPPIPSSAPPSDDYEVADLYDTIDDNTQKRLRKLAEKSSRQPKGKQIDVVDELYEEFDENADNELPDASNPQGSRCGTDRNSTISEMGCTNVNRQSSTRVPLMRCESISPPYTPPTSTPPETPAPHCPPSASPSPPPPPPMHPQHSSFPKHQQYSSPSPPPPPPGHPEHPSISPSPPPPPTSPPPPSLSKSAFCPPASSHLPQTGQSKSLPTLPLHIKVPPPCSMRPSTSKSLEASEQLASSFESQSVSTNIDRELHSSSPSLQPSFSPHSTKGAPSCSKTETTKHPKPALKCPKKSPLKPLILPKTASNNPSCYFQPSDSSSAHIKLSQQGNTTNQEDTLIKTARALESLNKTSFAHRMKMSVGNEHEVDSRQHKPKPKPNPKPKPLSYPSKAAKPLSSPPKLKQKMPTQNEVTFIASPKKQAKECKFQSQHFSVDPHTINKLFEERSIQPKETVLGTNYTSISEDNESQRTHLTNSNFEKFNKEMMCADTLQMERSQCVPDLHSDRLKFDQAVSIQDAVLPRKQIRDPTAGKLKTRSEALSTFPKSTFEHQTTAQLKSRIELQQSKEDPICLSNSDSKVSTQNGTTSTIAQLEQNISERHHRMVAPITTQPNFKAALPVPHKKSILPPENIKQEALKMKELQEHGSEQSCCIDDESNKCASVKSQKETEIFSMSSLKGPNSELLQMRLNTNKPPILPKSKILSQKINAQSSVDATIQGLQADLSAQSCTTKPLLPQKPTSIKCSSPLWAPKESGSDFQTECNRIIDRKPTVPKVPQHGINTKKAGPGCKTLIPAHNDQHIVQSTADDSYAVKSKSYQQRIDGMRNRYSTEDQKRKSRSVSPLCSVPKSCDRSSFSSEMHESISADICNDETVENCSPQESIKPDTYMEQSIENRQSSQNGSAPVIKELSTVLFTMKSKLNAREQVQHHDNIDEDKLRPIHDTPKPPIQLKGWKAVHSTIESTQYKHSATKSSIDSRHLIPKSDKFGECKDSGFVPEPGKSLNTAIQDTKGLNHVQKSSNVRSMVSSEISTNYLSSNKPSIEPEAKRLSKCDERPGHVKSLVCKIQKPSR